MLGVIFDFNGTLFMDADKHLKAWSKIVYEMRGTKLQDDEMDKFHGQRNEAIIQMLSDHTIDSEQAAIISKRKESLYRDLCREDSDSLILVPGAIELFEELKKNKIPMSIATASIKENVEFFIETFDLHQWFPSEMIIYDDGILKDKTEMFHKAAHAMNVPIEECLIFEDSISGIKFAQDVACGKVIAISSIGKEAQYESLHVDGIINNFLAFDFNQYFGENGHESKS